MKPTITYGRMKRLPSFEQRLRYLMLEGHVAKETFGWERHLNQNFYRSYEWRKVREAVIVRDGGCDLAIPERPIHGKLLVHHINPIRPEDIKHSSDILVDPNNLVCVSNDTHTAIHYGSLKKRPPPYVERQPGDTKLW